MKEELFQRLNNYFRFDKRNHSIATLIKSMIILTTGALFGDIVAKLNTGTYNAYQIIGTLILIVVFLYLESINLRKQKNFPLSLIDNLQALSELEETKKNLERQRKVFEFIDNSILSLNNNTCPVSDTVTIMINETICHQDLKASLADLLKDFINRTNYFLEVDKASFTNGVFLQDVITIEELISGPIEDQKIFVFNDDLKIEHCFYEHESHNENEKYCHFQLTTSIRECIEFKKYQSRQIQINNETHTIILSPIPHICEPCPPKGCLFAIYKGPETCNCDSNKVLDIHGRILTNWISKYEDCLKTVSIHEKIFPQSDAHRSPIPTKEVLDSIEQQRMSNNS
jgi:hypothetical protein